MLYNWMIRVLTAALLSGGMAHAYDSEPASAAPASRAVIPAAVSAPTAPAVEEPPAATVPDTVTPVRQEDYNANRRSEVFGAHLFSGAFAQGGASQFNPDYAVAAGDRIRVRLWGAFNFDSVLTVDPKGNVFLPYAGPVMVLGVRNQDLQRVIEGAVGRAFRANVYSYASLAAAQPVRVFVSGFVRNPGQYRGTSLDSVLHYLDQAGGIDPDRGSFLRIEVKRGSSVRASINLYDFLLGGVIPQVQLADGDVIFVSERQNVVRVSASGESARQFEFGSGRRTVADIVRLARPAPSVTHVRLVRNSGALRNVEYYSLQQAADVPVVNGDELVFTADRLPGSITVRVEGEHQGQQEYVLPTGARLRDLLQQVRFTERSERESLQLFRVSVKERQRQTLQASLRGLETAALTARSGTSDEARLRQDEAALLLQWVERARKIEPSGQVVLAGSADSDTLPLENGDILRIPARDGLVLIGGEVLFPNSVAWDGKLDVQDYIQRAGGYTQNADSSRVIIAHRDGRYTDVAAARGFFDSSSGLAVRPGDEILVLPRIDVKSRQIWKDMTQILYQIAVSAKVVFGL